LSYYDDPEIIDVIESDDRVTVYFYLDPRKNLFRDHFGEHAILPGVTQLKWVFEFGKRMIPKHNSYSMHDLKFRRPILPGEKYHLEVATAGKTSIYFSFSLNGAVYSDGTLHFSDKKIE